MPTHIFTLRLRRFVLFLYLYLSFSRISYVNRICILIFKRDLTHTQYGTLINVCKHIQHMRPEPEYLYTHTKASIHPANAYGISSVLCTSLHCWRWWCSVFCCALHSQNGYLFSASFDINRESINIGGVHH